MSATISWNIPYPILQNPDYTKINIYRGTNENDINSYTVIASIDRWVNGDVEKETDTYYDAQGNDTLYYFVRYTDGARLSKILLTNFELSPKEQRWVEQLRQMLDPIICSTILEDGTMRPMSDADLMLGIRMALDYFNTYPPMTEFTFANFPKGGGYEGTILMFAQVFTLLGKYIGLSLRDFSYSDNGLSLNQNNWGQAVGNAIDKILGILNPLMQKTKMDFSDSLGTSVGSSMWAVGTNGMISGMTSSVFNILRGVTLHL